MIQPGTGSPVANARSRVVSTHWKPLIGKSAFYIYDHLLIVTNEGLTPFETTVPQLCADVDTKWRYAKNWLKLLEWCGLIKFEIGESRYNAELTIVVNVPPSFDDGITETVRKRVESFVPDSTKSEQFCRQVLKQLDKWHEIAPPPAAITPQPAVVIAAPTALTRAEIYKTLGIATEYQSYFDTKPRGEIVACWFSTTTPKYTAKGEPKPVPADPARYVTTMLQRGHALTYDEMTFAEYYVNTSDKERHALASGASSNVSMQLVASELLQKRGSIALDTYNTNVPASADTEQIDADMKQFVRYLTGSLRFNEMDEELRPFVTRMGGKRVMGMLEPSKLRQRYIEFRREN